MKPATASAAPITAVRSQRDTQGDHPPTQPFLQMPCSWLPGSRGGRLLVEGYLRGVRDCPPQLRHTPSHLDLEAATGGQRGRGCDPSPPAAARTPLHDYRAIHTVRM